MQHDRKTAPAALERAEEAAVAQAGNVSLYINATSNLFPPRELQRGVSVQSVLASCTNIFTVLPDKLALDDRERLFERSRPVSAIDSFVSHAWRSDGNRKWMALALHEVGHLPVAVAIFACLAMSCLQRAVELPGNVRTLMVADNPTVLLASPWEYLAGLLAAVASAFLLLAMQQRIYFVDAACIHQANRALKTTGIRHLAGYVAMSQRLLVLWDEHYFDRLWCVYELATFSAIHPNKPVIFLPLRSAIATFVTVALEAIAFGMIVVFHILLFDGDMPGSLQGPALLGQGWWETEALLLFLVFVFVIGFGYFLICIGATMFGADMALQRVALQKHLESFDVRAAGCYSAADRVEIYAAIGSMYARNGMDGLDAFNQMVRTALKDEVLQRLHHGDRTTLPYSTLLLVMLPLVCLQFGFINAALRETSAFSQALCFVLIAVATFAVVPSVVAMAFDRGARLARSSNQPDLPTFASQARLAIAWAAVRGATEMLLTSLSAFFLLCMMDFPEVVGLSQMPRALLLAFACLFCITWLCMARCTFWPRADHTSADKLWQGRGRGGDGGNVAVEIE